MMRVKPVRKYNSGIVKASRPKIKVNWGKLLLIILLLVAVAYGVFAYISFKNIKAVNPLREQGSHYYLLSNGNNDLKKTLIVFENKVNNQDVIERVYVYGRNETKTKTVLVYVPNWIYYGGLENDFGSAVPISSFKYAGDFLQAGRGVEYTVWQLEQLLGMSFDDYIWFTPTSLNAIEENLGEIESGTLYSGYYQNGDDISEESLFLNNFISHLNWVRLVFSAKNFQNTDAVIYSSYSSIMSVFVELKNMQGNIYETLPYLIDLSTSGNIIQKESSTSGGLVNYLNSIGFDSTWRNLTSKMLDRKLEQERVRVEIYNGSDIAGAASQFARKIQNAGCEVVRYDNAPNSVDITTFYVPNPQSYPKSLEVISELFPGQYEQLAERPLFMTTGDIVIVLGKDISKMYSF